LLIKQGNFLDCQNSNCQDSSCHLEPLAGIINAVCIVLEIRKQTAVRGGVRDPTNQRA